jgi:dimethylamine monooxygenase subunit B
MRFVETWTQATLVATRDLTPSIREFLLLPEHFAGAAYPVGSHIEVAVTIDGRPETRSYSLVGECGADGYRIAIRRAEDSRGGSRYMWSLAPGARPAMSLPSSLLSRRHYCLVAGGISITPIIGAAQALARRDAAFTLHYAVRSRGDAAYVDLLAGLLGDRLKLHAGDEGHRLDLEAVFGSLPRKYYDAVLRSDADAGCRAPCLDHGRPSARRPALRDLRFERIAADGLVPPATQGRERRDLGPA